MPAYLLLARLTSQGAQNLRSMPEGIERAGELLRQKGIESRGTYAALGRYDFVALLEAPDDETMAAAALALASRGNVSTETLRLFSLEQFAQMVASLPS